MRVKRWWCELAWLGGPEPAPGVLLEATDGVLSAVTRVAQAPADAVRLPGLVLPGLADTHVHCFHRALRSVTQSGRGDFWGWRRLMYDVAARLTPDTYYTLARATYGELALAGVTCVGEFHYVHHQADGRPYAAANAMGEALVAAAGDVGIRLTLLDTCYVAGGFGTPLGGVQRRFGDGDASGWAERVAALQPSPTVRIGAAIHSVRAVPADQLPVVAEWTATGSSPLHMHVSEQPAENEACLAATGRTPAALLDRAGALHDRSTVVHATHLSDDDVRLLGDRRVSVAMCPTTERDLADGIGPAWELADAGCPIVLGSDSCASIDLLGEARALEMDERLRSGRRGSWDATALLRAATVDGHRSLGWPEAGVLTPGAPADFIRVDLSSVRVAGTPAGSELVAAVFAATAADVADVVVAGEPVVTAGGAVRLDVAAELRSAVVLALGGG